MPLPDHRALPPCAQRESILQSLSKIEDRRRVLAAEERQLHSSWNATLPIHHLPRELLVDIFATALRSSWTSLGESETETTTAATGGKRAVLMLVCSAWRELIASEGTLWSLMYVTPSTPLAILSLHKLRSAKAALEVRLDMKPDNSLEAARILAPESERIRSLSIPSARDLPLPTFHALFCDKSWPLLTHLDIKFSFRSSEQHITQIDLEPILKLSALRFPNLQSLALSSGPIPAIDVQLLRQLKSLKVYSHCPVEWPSFQQFLTDLSQAVQLEALTIGRRGCYPRRLHHTEHWLSKRDSGYAFDASALPRLRSVTINVACPQEITPIVTHALLPPVPMTINLSLCDFFATQASQTRLSFVDALFPNRVTSPLPLALHCADVTVQANQLDFSGHRSLSKDDDPLRLSVVGVVHQFYVNPYALAEALEDLVLLCNDRPLKSLWIANYSADKTTSHSWRGVFRAFPELEKIEVKGCFDMLPLFEALHPSSLGADAMAANDEAEEPDECATRLRSVSIAGGAGQSPAQAKRLLEKVLYNLRLRDLAELPPLASLVVSIPCVVDGAVGIQRAEQSVREYETQLRGLGCQEVKLSLLACRTR